MLVFKNYRLEGIVYIDISKYCSILKYSLVFIAELKKKFSYSTNLPIITFYQEGDVLKICLGMHRGAGEEEGNGIGAGRLTEKIITN